MTDRVKGCIVTFNRDIRVDDVECIVEAIKMIKGVSSVNLSVTNIDDHMNRHRVMSEVKSKFYNFIEDLEK